MEPLTSAPPISIDTRMDPGPCPDIIHNRFDLRFPGEQILWLHVGEDPAGCAVGLRRVGDRAWVGLLHTPVSPELLHAVFHKIFSRFPGVRRISFQCTRQDPSAAWPYIRIHASTFWYLDLPGSWEALLARATGKFRRRLKYEQRRLEKAAGPVRCLRYSVSCMPETIGPLFLAFKGRKYADKTLTQGVSGILNGRNIPASHCYVLQGQQEVLAILFTAEDPTQPYLLNLTYNPDFAPYSPGKLLYVQLLRSLIGQGRKILYLGSGDYLYKHFFGSVTTGYWVGDAFRDLAALEGEGV